MQQAYRLLYLELGPWWQVRKLLDLEEGGVAKIQLSSGIAPTTGYIIWMVSN